MKTRRNFFFVLFFLLLSVVVLLQINSFVQLSRFSELLDRVEDTFEGASDRPNYQTTDYTDAEGKKLPGDEGDWLIWAFHVEPKTLNQISAEGDIYSRWITVPYIFEPLLMYDFDKLVLKPWLADSYNISDDGLEISFHLRDDIHFSDGEPVTSDDVVFTYETIINPMVDAAPIANLYVDVNEIVKIDRRTVKFVMKRPYFKALENLSFWDFGILPKHIYEFTNAEEFNNRISNPIGSGPFVFEKWDTGREVVLRRNENYWGVKPKLEKFVFRFIGNNVAALQALRSGKVDMMIPDPEQFTELVDDSEFNEKFACLSYWNPGVPFYYMGWNQDMVFFADRRVRLAMTHIINREYIVEHLLKGNGKVITGPFFVDGTQNDPAIEPWPYDLDKARRLLDEAGWIDTDGDGIRDKDGVAFRFKFMYSVTYVLYERIAKLLKDQAARIGIEVIPEPYEWSVIVGRLNDRKFEAMIMGWGGDILEDPYQLWHSSQIGNRGSNYVGFSDSRADEIIERARRTIDDDTRNQLYYEFHRMVHEEQPYTFLFTRPTLRLVDRRFKNVIIHKMGPKYWQWYVPASEQRYGKSRIQ